MRALSTARLRAMGGQWPSILALLGSIIFFASRAARGIWFLPFIDEPEHLLGGKMLDSGAILYRDFVSQHGPFPFMAMQSYGAIFGWAHPNYARCVEIVLAAGAAAAIAWGTRRLTAAAIFLSLISCVWLVQALYCVSYYAMGGFWFAIAIGAFIGPVWLDQKTSKEQAAVAGAALIFAAATAYPYAVTGVLLTASILAARRDQQTVLAFLAGIGIALAANLLWFLFFGDLRGYVAFHLVENQFYFAPHASFGLKEFFSALLPSADPIDRVNTLAIVFNYASLAILLAHGRHRLAIILGWLGILVLLARGNVSLHNQAFLVTSIAVFAIALPIVIDRLRSSWQWFEPLATIALLTVVSVLWLKPALYGVGYFLTERDANKEWVIGQETDPAAKIIAASTSPNDSLLVLPYGPSAYFDANRLPMRRYFQYFFWDAEYGKHPVLGVTHDLCVDFPKDPPAAVHVLWGEFTFIGGDHHYLDCLRPYLKADYWENEAVPGLYIRNHLHKRERHHYK